MREQSLAAVSGACRLTSIWSVTFVAIIVLGYGSNTSTLWTRILLHGRNIFAELHAASRNIFAASDGTPLPNATVMCRNMICIMDHVDKPGFARPAQVADFIILYIIDPVGNTGFTRPAQLWLFIYFATTTLATVIVLVVSRGCRSAERTNFATSRPIVRQKSCTSNCISAFAGEMKSFVKKFNMRPKTFVRQVMRRNLQLKHQVAKNKKSLKQFAWAAQHLKEKNKDLQAILNYEAYHLLSLEKKRPELLRTNTDMRKKVGVLEKKLVNVGLLAEPDAPKPQCRRPVKPCCRHPVAWVP